MSTQTLNLKNIGILVAVMAWPALASSQVPVDESGNPVAAYEPETAAGTEELTILSGPELEGIIGPIALYPDDLLAIVLPASTYPLQIVQAARFLKNLETDPSLKPDPDWDDSIVALSNYPEVVEMMADDLDWTWRLGEAVVAQQPAVIAAIERFRDRAYAAGNLKSDDRQTVAQEDGVIQITPVQDDVIYVPYYEPERVVVYQPRPVYYYYPRPYPVYYYPYPSGYGFHDGFFWGVTSAFSIGWYTDRLHIFHHSYHGHPYYGRSYWNNWWYRRPDIHIHNNYYVTRNKHVATNRYRDGDYWRPQERRTVRRSDQRITRTRYFPNQTTNSTQTATTSGQVSSRRDTLDAPRATSRGTAGKQIERTSATRGEERGTSAPRVSDRGRELGEPSGRKLQSPKADIAFRDRPTDTARTTTTRPSTQIREPQVRGNESRKAQLRQAESRQPQVRQSEPRQPQVRKSEPRQMQTRQSTPRQPKVTRSPSQQPKVSQSRPRQVQSRQPQPRSQSQPRQVQSRPAPQPQRSQSKPSKPRSSSKGASQSSKKSSSRRSGSDRG